MFKAIQQDLHKVATDTILYQGEYSTLKPVNRGWNHSHFECLRCQKEFGLAAFRDSEGKCPHCGASHVAARSSKYGERGPSSAENLLKSYQLFLSHVPFSFRKYLLGPGY